MAEKNYLRKQTLMDRILSDEDKDALGDYNSASFADKIQYALGMYAKPSKGGVADNRTKKLMKYHGTNILEVNKETGIGSFKRKGKKATVKMPEHEKI